MSLYGLFKKAGPSGFGYNSTAEQVTEGFDLSGQTWLLTGCNSGLGLETLRVLTLRGAKVIGAARTREKAAAAGASVSGEVVPLACELNRPESVKAAVKEVTEAGHRLDGIIANAGIMALPKPVIEHGLELQFLTNHVGHFLLVTGLLDRLTANGRVVMLSSAAHTGTYPEGIRLDDLNASGGYTAWGAYGQSKLANMLFARSLAKQLGPGQTANSVHPGVIPTNLGRHMPKAVVVMFRTLGPALVLKTIPSGAATQVYVATHPDAAGITGEYFADCNPAESSPHGRDDALAEALWVKTEEIVAGL
jgi:WW domain-containing oxidoreductase